jgi:hypothetical protein
VVVMVEHGGGGGATAGPIASRVYNTLFGLPDGKPAQGTSPGDISPFVVHPEYINQAR